MLQVERNGFKALTERQLIFVEEMLTHGMKQRAAIAAGVNPKRAAVTASEWTNPEMFPNVVEAIRVAKIKRREESGVEAAEVAAKLLEVANFDPMAVVDPKTGEPMTIPAKKARTVVKALALKGLKEMV